MIGAGDALQDESNQLATKNLKHETPYNESMNSRAAGSILHAMPDFDMKNADDCTANAVVKLNEQERELKLRYDAILEDLRNWIQLGLTAESSRAQQL